MRLFTFALLALSLIAAVWAAKDPLECEVCKKVVDDVKGKLGADDKKNLVKIEDTIGKHCAKVKNDKETKLCYFIDPIKREISTPIKNGVPTDVICQRLKKKSAEICSLRFASVSTSADTITPQSDFSKLRISQLKAFMAEKGVSCPECIEKDDFIRKVKTHLGVTTKGDL